MTLLDYSKRNIRKNLLNFRYFARFFAVHGPNVISFLVVVCLLFIAFSVYLMAISTNTLSNVISTSQLLIYCITAIFSLLSSILTFYLIRLTRREGKKTQDRALQALEQSRFENKLKLIDNHFQLIINLDGKFNVYNTLMTLNSELSQLISNYMSDKSVYAKRSLLKYNNTSEELFSILVIRIEITKICGNDKDLLKYAYFKFYTQFLRELTSYMSLLENAIEKINDDNLTKGMKQALDLYNLAKLN